MRNLQVEKDIYQAKKVILNNKKYSKYYRKYSVISIKGTENIKELFSKVKNLFQTILIVTGSGDQLLEAVLHGAKKITCFDINRLAKYGCQLKIAAVKALSYEEFVSFYSRGFSLDLFKKVSEFLEEDAFLFWNQIFSLFSHYDIHTYLFDTKVHTYGGLADYNASIYSEEEYYKIKENLKNVQITYVDSHLLEIPKQKEFMNQSYDLAYLSNIYYYLGKGEKFYSQFLKNKIIPLLNENGEVFLHYLYGAGGKLSFNSFRDLLWDDYNQESIKNLEKYISLTKYFVSNSGYGNLVGEKDVVLSLKR